MIPRLPKTITYLDKVQALYPNIEKVSYWSAQYDGTPWQDPYDGLIWENQDIVKPTKAELDAVTDDQINRSRYKELRESEYPSIGDQLDMIFKCMVAGHIPPCDEFVQAIQTIKTKYPKPNNK